MKNPSKKNSPENVRVVYYDWSKFLPTLTSVAFALLVALVIARATTGDTLRDAFDATPGAAGAAQTGLPNISLWLDVLCWIPALLVLARRGFDRTYVLRFTYAHAALLALCLLAFASVLWAADKWAAGVTAFHFVSAGVLCWAASQLVRSWTRLRFVAAAAVAVLAIYAAHGLYYRLAEWPDMMQYLERQKPQILRERGWTEDSFAWQQFLRKANAGEMVGFFASPNTLAATSVMLVVVACCLAIQRVRDDDEKYWAAALFISVPAAAYLIAYTGSKAAFLSPILAAALVWIGMRFGGRIAERKRTWFFAGCAAFLAGSAALVGHGMYRGSLVVDSLTFRWKYWAGSFRVFTEHALAGVGWSNFPYFYLAKRLPDASEEIKDPHNLFVKVFVELGIIGGILAVVWIARMMWEITRPIAPPPPASPNLASSSRQTLGLIFAVAAVASLLAIGASVDFSRDTTYAMAETLKRILYFGIILLCLAAGTIRSSKIVAGDDRPAPLLLIGCVVAIGIFLLQNLIDFAMWEIGPMFAFVLLAGATLGVRGESLVGKRKWNRAAMVAFAVTLVAWLIAIVAFVMPMASAESQAIRGDEALRTSNFRNAVGHYRAAYDTAPLLNSDYARRVARALIGESVTSGKDDSRAIDVWLSLAIAANPRDVESRLARATFWMTQPEDRQPRPQIASDFKRAIEVDPMSVPTRLNFATVLEMWGDKPAAKREYEEALRINSLLHPDEPERLSAERIKEIEAKIAAL